MDNKEFAKKLEVRTRKFALMIIKLSSSLSESPEHRVVRYQITKSGTSVGANYREANRSRSSADFYHKIKISETEASETVYWLEVVQDAKWLISENVQPILKEANEILAIFTSIAIKLKKK
ncbi:MAG: four helix bundle protein [Flavobacteriales bacterium]|nr:four helix bundle protein [Flavobacteriales bacterium]MCK5946074.1 four helix bundle protein [Mycoplasmataceae bacterium]